MAADPLLHAAPFLAAVMGAEAWLLRRSARPYSAREALGALGCVALDQLSNAATLGLFLGACAAARGAMGASDEATVGVWVAAVIGHDLAYYAFHRASHRVTALWAAHAVHHQSSSYDLTVSLRQGAVATWITYLFYLPLALLVPPHVFAAVHGAYQLWQFFAHTRLCPSLGPLEAVLATPRHHRLHHGRNTPYLEANYGGFFIVFDRLFGSFARETEPVDYGVVGGFSRVSPLFANTYLFARLARASRGARSARALARLWLGPPEVNAALLHGDGSRGRPGPVTARAVAWVAAGLGAAGLSLLLPAPAAARVALGLAAVACIEAGSAAADRGV